MQCNAIFSCELKKSQLYFVLNKDHTSHLFYEHGMFAIQMNRQIKRKMSVYYPLNT